MLSPVNILSGFLPPDSCGRDALRALRLRAEHIRRWALKVEWVLAIIVARGMAGLGWAWHGSAGQRLGPAGQGAAWINGAALCGRPVFVS
jgi:hypothetical protein